MQQSGVQCDDPPCYRNEPGQITLARLLMARQQFEEADTLLHRLIASVTEGKRTHRLIEIQALQAVLLHRRGNADAAMHSLAEALTLAEPGGYVRLFIDHGPCMAKLLVRLLHMPKCWRGHHFSLPYLHTLLQASAATEPEEAAVHDAAKGLLSEREIAIIRQLDGGRSTHEIADNLILGASTIRWHIKNIYAKLSVHNRPQLLTQARELGII